VFSPFHSKNSISIDNMNYKECKTCGNNKKAEKCLCSDQYVDCSVCGNKLKKTAKKCTHCNHWIDGSTFYSRFKENFTANIKDTGLPKKGSEFVKKQKKDAEKRRVERKEWFNSEEYKQEQYDKERRRENDEKTRKQQYAESLEKSRESTKHIYKKLRGWILYFTINNLVLLLFFLLVRGIGDLQITNPSNGFYLENFTLVENHHYQLTYIYSNGVMPFISFAGIFFIIYLFPYYLLKIFFAKFKPEIREEYKSYKGAKIGNFSTTSILWIQIIIFGFLFLINYWIYQIYEYLA